MANQNKKDKTCGKNKNLNLESIVGLGGTKVK